MKVTISVRETENAIVVKAEGRIALGASGPSLQETVRELVASGHQHIVLDLGGVTYMDSSGLGWLIGSYATAVSRDSEIKLSCLNKKVYDLMQITKLLTVFSIYTDEAAAVRSFEPAVASAS
jgi:anti-sigma B factor antagonist